MTASVGIYIHVPFCKSKCLYCDFHSVTGMEGRIGDYVDALTTELRGHSKRHEGVRVGSIFFGGGTPSLLTPANIKKILHTVSENYSLDNDIEITLESNPESLTLAKLKGYRNAGVRRISVGVQSLDDRLLERLGRIHTVKEALKALEWAREAGFESLSADFMFNLPGQTQDDWSVELDRISSLDLNHLSVYELTLEPGTPMWKERDKMQRGDSLTMFDMAEATLTKARYHHYEISNYCKSGHESVHNLGYWNYHDYIGIGAGAHGCRNGVRYVNVKKIESYIDRASRRGGAVYRSEPITDEMERLERLMLGLRLKNGVALSQVEVTPQIMKLVREQFLTLSGKRLKATKRGWRMLDSVLENI